MHDDFVCRNIIFENSVQNALELHMPKFSCLDQDIARHISMYTVFPGQSIASVINILQLFYRKSNRTTVNVTYAYDEV